MVALTTANETSGLIIRLVVARQVRADNDFLLGGLLLLFHLLGEE